MSRLVPLVRAVVREELSALRTVELGVVTAVATNEGGSGDSNIDVNLQLRGSGLELQRVPVSLARLGLSMAPREGDLAVIGFVAGELNAPVVIGMLYDDQARPPDAKPSEIVYEVPDDAASGDRCLEIKLPSGNTLTVKDATVEIAMGSTMLTVEADGDVTLEAGGNLNLKAGGSIAVEAGGEVTIKGLSVTAEGQTEVKLKGVQVAIAGLTSFSAS